MALSNASTSRTLRVSFFATGLLRVRALLDRRLLPCYAIAALLALPSVLHAQGRTFIFRELSLALQYSAERSEVFSSSRPPGNTIGLEFMHTRKMPARGKIGLLGIDAEVFTPPV